MFELKDLPSRKVLDEFAKEYNNPDVDGLHTWLAWASATNEMLTAFEKNLARFNLSQTIFFVLLLLKRNPDGLSIGALANGVAVTSQAMTRAIAKMEKNDFCTRHSDPNDARYWIVRLAPNGEKTLDEVLPDHYMWVSKLMSQFTSDEKKTLLHLMLKISPNLSHP